MASHVKELSRVQKFFDLEPLFLVYFSFMTDKIVTKDALSKVSRNFYKEFKMNYNRLSCSTVTYCMVTLLKFFETGLTETVRSYFQFNLIILCETLAQEQFKLALQVTKERQFVTQQGMNKFTEELAMVNELNKVLFHNSFLNF
jgi:hypothetical protein